MATQDALSAIYLAKRGKHFTNLEEIIHDVYYWAREHAGMKANSNSPALQVIRRSQNPVKDMVEWHQLVEQLLGEHLYRLQRFFTQAVLERDTDAIRTMADAIDTVKGVEARGQSADQYRERILTIKYCLLKPGETATISELANLILWKYDDAHDGHSTLRRLCRELDFPLAPTRQIRKKRSLKALKKKHAAC